MASHSRAASERQNAVVLSHLKSVLEARLQSQEKRLDSNGKPKAMRQQENPFTLKEVLKETQF